MIVFLDISFLWDDFLCIPKTDTISSGLNAVLTYSCLSRFLDICSKLWAHINVSIHGEMLFCHFVFPWTQAFSVSNRIHSSILREVKRGIPVDPSVLPWSSIFSDSFDPDAGFPYNLEQCGFYTNRGPCEVCIVILLFRTHDIFNLYFSASLMACISSGKQCEMLAMVPCFNLRFSR